MTLSRPREPWVNAPGRLLSAADTLDHDLGWLHLAPIAIFRDAVAFVTSSLHVGRGITCQWKQLTSVQSRLLWVAALPAGTFFYLAQAKWPFLARRLPSP